MDSFEQLLTIAERYNLNEIKQLLLSARELNQQKYIDIAVLGQFKAGKSSFINSLIGQNLLPTGVIPVTAIVTRIFYKKDLTITIHFQNGRKQNISLEQLPEFITEALNPNNQKSVSLADIGTPKMAKFKNLRFIDTPGLGSIFENNTQTTQQWQAKTTIAIIVISAERPLSEADKKLLDQIKQFSYKTYCILSKTDLFDQKQLQEITRFVSQNLRQILNAQVPVLHYSIKKDTEKHKQQIIKTIFEPLLQNPNTQISQIYQYKLLRAATLLQNYLQIALKASRKTQQEQQQLREQIFNSTTSSNFLYQQVQLIASDLKSHVRSQLEEFIMPHKKLLINQIQQKFKQEYPAWRGNLYRISRQYEKWLKQTLGQHIRKIVDQHHPQMQQILDSARKSLEFFTQTFTQKLSEKIRQSLGLDIKTLSWQAELPKLKSPDISVYRAFDSNIDLLWFLFPMLIFKNIFEQKFLRQIPMEVEKNLYRTVSILTGMINKQIENLAQQAIKYINQYIETISKALTIETEKIQQLTTDLQTIEKITQTY